MFRDFSDEAKQKLLKYVDEVTADGTWDRVKDWFGDAGLTIQSCSDSSASRTMSMT